jgi:hypothetical protein
LNQRLRGGTPSACKVNYYFGLAEKDCGTKLKNSLTALLLQHFLFLENMVGLAKARAYQLLKAA